MSPRVKLAQIASRQHGVFTTDQAFAAGLTPVQLRKGVARGTYEQIYKGVYAHAGAPRTRHLFEVAGCKWAGPRAALSHRSALADYQLADVRAEVIEITTVGRRCPNPQVLLHRTDYLPDNHIVRRSDRRVTDPARTLFDAGAVVAPRTVTKAVIEAIQRHLVTKDQLVGRLIEHGGRGRRGCAALRAALDFLDPDLAKTTSALEALMLDQIWNGRLPRPVFQYPLRYKGRVLRIDFAYPQIRLGIEGDGRKDHDNPLRWDYDNARDTDLMADLDWLILHFTWNQVKYRPEWCIDRIRKAYETRSALFFGTEARSQAR
jgi:predicted transcriptional regulator of viral defense system